VVHGGDLQSAAS